MATNSPFELEDQTDEDFFDKLVDDDDDVVAGLKNTGFEKNHDILDGDESDEAKTFANLSISEVGNGNGNGDGNGDSGAKGITGSDDNIGEERVEAKEYAVGDVEGTPLLASSDSFSFDNGQLSEDGVMISEDKIMEPEEQVLGDVEGTPLLAPSDSFSFDNGQSAEDGVMTSEATSALRRESSGVGAVGIKEVHWSAFSESAEHGSAGFGSYSDFFTDLGEGGAENIPSESKTVSGNETSKITTTESSYSSVEYHAENGAAVEQSGNVADTNGTHNWENLYPGWRYDPNTGQWYQLDGYDGTSNGLENFDTSVESVQGNLDMSGDSHWATSDIQSSSQVSYAQQTVQSEVSTVSSQISTTENMSGWNHTSLQSGEYQYPAHMVFDPQYPGWYYDTIAQEWRSLDSYHLSTQSIDQTHNQQAQNGYLSTTAYSHGDVQSISNDSEGLNQSWAASSGYYGHPEVVTNSVPTVNSSGDQSWQSSYDSNVYSNSHVGQHKSYDPQGSLTSYDQKIPGYDSSNWGGGLQQFNHTSQGNQSGPVQYPTDYYGSQNTANVSQPFFPNGHHVSAPRDGRSSAGRPPHALVTFGFGGKLVVMKDNSTAGFSLLGNKDTDGRLISVLNLIEVVSVNNGLSGSGAGPNSYFHSLCLQSFPGPLVGGNAGSKELNKWIDDRIANCESLDTNYDKGGTLKLLLSLLKVACQHYGKLRSFGGDSGLMENDLPESAVAKLFASVKRNGGQFRDYSAISKCLVTLPSEADIQATASEVQNLLISGKKKDALQRAQQGQLWGFALILAQELGDQFYAETVKQMAVSQLVVGSPLRTLCLLIAKKPEEVFSANITAGSNLPGAVHMAPQPMQSAGYSMLDNWEENLAVITSNRTENDHLVIIHLGDCLWKERNDVTAAHICYLVAEADFELYSESARLCLIGADHWNFPRTYASPEAIQRTELFEYSKVLGNSQFVLLPLQRYKLIYAHMLAEVGRVSDSLRYCQAVYKSLKTGRSPEADTLKQLLSSLEERIRTHQQSGYAANLAPAKIVGKLLNFFDSTAHRVVGGLPPAVPSTTQGNVHGDEHHFQPPGAKLSVSQSTMVMSSLTPSASMEPISQWAVDGSKMTLQNRSNSEPDIGRTPRPEQVESSNEASSSSAGGKQSGSTGTSRFGRLNFGATILQKTVGLVLKPRQGRQAKLGESNRFYYDEKLKRWVEEGVEPPAEEQALPPPPTTAFQNGNSGYNNLKSALNDGLHATDGSPESTNLTPPGSSPGIPTIPPSSNQFSARGRMGVRSRYVDTFNKGGSASTNTFQPPSIPSTKPASVASAKFFIPTATSSNDQMSGTEVTTRDEASESRENPSMSINDPFQNLSPSPVGIMPRFPSVDNIPHNSSMTSQSRRTASWGAIHGDTRTPLTTTTTQVQPSLHMNGGNFGDDLQEVEL